MPYASRDCLQYLPRRRTALHETYARRAEVLPGVLVPEREHRPVGGNPVEDRSPLRHPLGAASLHARNRRKQGSAHFD